jgi:transketolase
MAERTMAAIFNQPSFEIFNHFTYAIVSDGDLMEGVTSEASSLAGTQALGKLICLYDDNQVTIEGGTDLAFSEDTRARYLAYGWHVSVVSDGENLEAISLALEKARAESERPSLIMCRTKLGAGSPKEGQSRAHGEPLGAQALEATRAFYGYAGKPPFFLDERVGRNFKERGAAYESERTAWEERLIEYEKKYPELAKELHRRLEGRLPIGWEDKLKVSFDKNKPLATRSASQVVVSALAPLATEILGGSADLGPSNKTELKDLGSLSPLNPRGRNVHYGVREQAMGAIMNGLALHGGFIPFGGTFLVFVDFLRPAVRLSSLMNLKVIYVLTHDSVGVGEDGPTHQPIEQLASLRIIPNLMVFRPADAYETIAAWRAALSRTGPSALILSRQDLPILDPLLYPSLVEGALKGGYVLSPAPGGEAQGLIVASGSEVSLALETQKVLSPRRKVSVVSLPSWELFCEQSQAYRESVLPLNLTRRLGLEAGLSFGWERWLGPRGAMISVEQFGRSAPASKIFDYFGFTVENAVLKMEELFEGE